MVPGMTRMERWYRADKFDLSPPENVRQIISQHTDDNRYTEWSVWISNFDQYINASWHTKDH